MDGFTINDNVRNFLMERSGFNTKEVEAPVEDKKEVVVESKKEKEDEAEEVNEQETHFCPLCENELPEDFDDETLLERFSTLYENLTAITEAMESEENEETIEEEVEEETEEEDGPDDENEDEDE
jgi:hypothetical protein